jgi:ribonuclease HII
MWRFDRRHWTNPGSFSLVGIDEVGRGPLAGPVVACAVVLEAKKKEDVPWKWMAKIKVDDSKKLKTKARQQLLSEFGAIKFITHSKIILARDKNWSLSCGLAEVSPEKIDDINILRASLLAMTEAHDLLQVRKASSLALVDGNKAPDLKGRGQVQCVIKGDSKSWLIALASIIAKEYRDNLMTEFSRLYPHYGFERNAGYPTKSHYAAIEEYGACPIHRRSFRGVLTPN